MLATALHVHVPTTRTGSREVAPPRVRFDRSHRWSQDGSRIVRVSDGATIDPRSWAAR